MAASTEAWPAPGPGSTLVSSANAGAINAGVVNAAKATATSPSETAHLSAGRLRAGLCDFIVLLVEYTEKTYAMVYDDQPGA
jgi:hypothetical protein